MVANTPTTEEVLFSFDTLELETGETIGQIADLTGNGNTFGWEDVSLDNRDSLDRDYNDFVVQVQGATATAESVENSIYKNRDWLNTNIGQETLTYANRPHFDTGTFTVGSTGEFEFDYLYDGGWYQGELAVFSLTGMELLEPGSDEFIAEATRRAMTSSEEGYVLANEGAKFSEKLDWENDFNIDAEDYQGVETFQMTPGDEFAVMLVQHATVWEITDPTKIHQWGKLPLFSIPEANPGETKPEGQMVDVDGNGTYAFEDVRTDGDDSDADYNDFVFQFKGVQGTAPSIDLYSNSDRDWRNTEVGEEILSYANRAIFDQGVFQVGESGEVIIDYLYDGGFYGNTKIGIFSLDGMDIYQPGSESFIEEVVNRVQSNSTQGYTVIADATEAAKYSADLRWERDFNQDDAEYLGKEVFTMTPGDNIGLVLLPDGDFDDIATAPDWEIKKDPLFSMNTVNENDQIQTADILTSETGTIIGFEDVNLQVATNKDYNDIVLAIEGVQGIGLDPVEDVMANNRNWLQEDVGAEILAYFD